MTTEIQIHADVLTELKREPAINAAHIGVEVIDGVVTLAGASERPDARMARTH